ncbi:hypothetical protein FHY55_09900 [Oceanicola sp. D3]|uniref:hypothetical protein n=1 Tax=Oceanicola sp. D3 TaxID=2587163 RepID=UPI00111FD54C|nr:hypothetical protein [Oceanicola sp. D3]QDC09538.1 hypothetical protein FHY55_09900 [Oceanicola sp. D3]
MSNTAIIILVTVVFLGQIALVGALLWWAKKREALLRAHCAAAGWHFSTGREGRKTVTRISSPREGWVLQIVVQRSGGSSSSNTTRYTEWQDPSLALPHGLSILPLDIDGSRAADVERFAGMLGGGLAQAMLGRLLGSMAEEVPDLKPVPLEGSPALLMATPGAEDALRPIALHPAIPASPLPRSARPAIIRGRDGLSIRLHGALKRPEQIDAVVELGQTLAAALRASES